MSDMVECVIDSIRVSLMSQQRIVVLKELNADRYLTIWIGIYEAEAIALALQEVEVARPLTWDLLRSIFTALGANIVRVEVTAMRDETFYGNIVAELNGQTINIDSRPSDALALAVRAHVPILVAHEVMDSVGILPEEDLQEGGSAPASRPEKAAGEGGSEEPEGRLSVFEDFLDQLDLGDINKPNNEEDEPDKP
jgi:bifunctional DNase/RNase